MATATYTPTHCPDTGRKFTRAERKAANKARFKAEMTKASKAGKRKPAKASAPVTLREAIELVSGAEERHLTQGTKASKQALEQAKANLRNVEAAKSKPKRKPAKAGKPTKAPKPVTPSKAVLMRLTKAELVDMLMGKQAPKPEPASKPKRKAAKVSKPKATKARKATPQERTADKQERASHGPKGVGPITPQPEAPKADVSKARKAGKAQGERNRTERAKKLAVKWAFDVTYGGMFLPTQQAELKRLLGDVEVSTYEDVMATCM